MNPHFEAFLRNIGVFISVFFTIRWAEKSVIPVYDVPLNIITIVIAILLNYRGPFKLNI